MKTTITLKKFITLPSGAVRVTHATAPAIPESSPQPNLESVPPDEGFREMQHHRYTTPFPYQHWGLNE
jgi:hypothetical protein